MTPIQKLEGFIGTWEGSENGKDWAPIMDVKLSKIP